MMWLILKGQGVKFTDPVTGEQMPMTYPEDESYCAFNLHPKTGEQLDQSIYPHMWPIEGVAHKLALDIMKDRRKEYPHMSLPHATRVAKHLMNMSVDKMNEKHRNHGDPNHATEKYFADYNEDPMMTVMPAWARMNHGPHPGYKIENTEEAPTKNARGEITVYGTNKPNKRLGGPHPESVAFPSWREAGEILDSMHNEANPQYTSDGTLKGIPSRIGRTPHVDPQDAFMGINGEPSPFVRYSSSSRDPFSPFSMSRPHHSERQPIDAREIFGGLDPLFYTMKREMEAPKATVDKFLERGYDEATAIRMAGSKVGSFFNTSHVTGVGDGVNTTIRELTQKVMAAGGIDQSSVDREVEALVHNYVTSGMDDLGINNKNGEKLLTALALSQMARSSGVDTEPEFAESDVAEAFKHFTNASSGYNMERTEIPGEYLDTSHMRPDYPSSHAPALPIESGAGAYSDGPGRSLDEEMNADTNITLSTDPLHVLMESLQMADAKLDFQIMKSLPENRDYESLADAFSITPNDVIMIEQSLGDWDKIAKRLMVSPLVVKAVKVSLG